MAAKSTKEQLPTGQKVTEPEEHLVEPMPKAVGHFEPTYNFFLDLYTEHGWKIGLNIKEGADTGEIFRHIDEVLVQAHKSQFLSHRQYQIYLTEIEGVRRSGDAQPQAANIAQPTNRQPQPMATPGLDPTSMYVVDRVTITTDSKGNLDVEFWDATKPNNEYRVLHLRLDLLIDLLSQAYPGQVDASAFSQWSVNQEYQVSNWEVYWTPSSKNPKWKDIQKIKIPHLGEPVDPNVSTGPTGGSSIL